MKDLLVGVFCHEARLLLKEWYIDSIHTEESAAEYNEKNNIISQIAMVKKGDAYKRVFTQRMVIENPEILTNKEFHKWYLVLKGSQRDKRIDAFKAVSFNEHEQILGQIIAHAVDNPVNKLNEFNSYGIVRVSVKEAIARANDLAVENALEGKETSAKVDFKSEIEKLKRASLACVKSAAREIIEVYEKDKAQNKDFEMSDAVKCAILVLQNEIVENEAKKKAEKERFENLAKTTK